MAPPQPRNEPQQRKRPKYTRSKTGCLTCRVKKIKVSTRAPPPTRAGHPSASATRQSPSACAAPMASETYVPLRMFGTRSRPLQCTWPEGVPSRKKATPRKESVDGRPSTAESSGLSETSTPPTRDSTPPRRPQADYSLPPVVARRHRYLHLSSQQHSLTVFAVSHLRRHWARILNPLADKCMCSSWRISLRSSLSAAPHTLINFIILLKQTFCP